MPAVEIAAALARLVQGSEPLLLLAPAREPRRDSRTALENRTFERPARPARNQAARNAPRRDKSSPRSVDAPVPTRAAAQSIARNPVADRADYPPHRQPDVPPAPSGLRRDEQGTPRHDDRDRARTQSRPPRSHHVAERERTPRGARHERKPHAPDSGFETFRIEVGDVHGVKPGNIVGAIANEAGLDSKHIGRVDIRDDHSLVDLPEGMPAEIFKHLKKVWVSGQQLRITRGGDEPDSTRPRRPHSPKPPSFKPSGFDKPKRRDDKKRGR